MSSGMTGPPTYSQDGENEQVENCRDYLRTGRCKYGTSCKYKHPPNVQSGGGLKIPLDPREPMFPVRPNEPICQYYIKHGSCKFGQACKFHHPPQSQMPVAAINGQPVLMNTAPRKIDAPQLVMNPVGTDSNGGHMMVQFLPQRPDEPDCIYFLKNGRCKYGATCRYHHPVNYHQQRGPNDVRRTNIAGQDAFNGQRNVQYVAQSASNFQQGQVVVADNGSFNLVNFEGQGQPQTYRQMNTVQSPDGNNVYCLPIRGTATATTEQGSSVSSIESSYDTQNAEALWNRARKNGSGGSLSAFVVDPQRGQTRSTLPNSSSESSLRRNRAASYGSASDHSAFYEVGSTMSRTSSSGSWLNEDPSRRVPGSESVSDRSPTMRGRPPPSGQNRRNPRRGPRAGENDEGFTMMTSALLNMLDTPEEASAESYSDEDVRHSQPSYSYPSDQIDPSMFDRLSLNSTPSVSNQYRIQDSKNGDSPQWSPVWQGSLQGPELEDKTRTGHMGSPAADSSQYTSDYGLYLP